MEFWNDDIPRLLRRPKITDLSVNQQHKNKTTRKPRPGLLDILDREYGNHSEPANVLNARANSSNDSEFGLPSNLGDKIPVSF